MKISGADDGVANLADINSNKSRLPAQTTYVLIKGANHSQFGYYGFQLDDNKAGISRAEQQKVILENVLNFIR